MAHVPEGRGVIAELTVEENLRLGGLWRGRRRGAGGRDLRPVPAAGGAADPAGIAAVGRRAPDALDRAGADGPAAACCCSTSRRSGLAPVLVAQIMSLVRELADTLGLTVLLVEQNARSALSIANRGIVLNLGRVVAEQDPAKLAADDRLLHAYLGF